MSVKVCSIKSTKSLFKNYCYIVFDEQTKDALIIDPAWEIEKIKITLQDNQVIPRKILLTHHHFDHTNLVNQLVADYNLQVLMSEIEIEYYNFSCPNLYAITEFTTIYIGAQRVIPFQTPGHSKGSMCFLIEKFLFTGDTLFIEGCGVCQAKGGDPTEMFNSLQQLKAQITLDTIIYPGHAYKSEPGKDFRYVWDHNIYLQIEDLKKFVAFRMRKNFQDTFGFQ
ncbi:MAG TPA: MBL fold metallo-hydrolase [Flavitalea sp.]|nr:MBL fold metallo-hydrolase [Flavitalea sp.]